MAGTGPSALLHSHLNSPKNPKQEEPASHLQTGREAQGSRSHSCTRRALFLLLFLPLLFLSPFLSPPFSPTRLQTLSISLSLLIN